VQYIRQTYLPLILPISPGVLLNTDAAFTIFQSLGSEVILSNGVLSDHFKPS